MAVKDLIQGKKSKEKNEIKAQEFSKLKKPKKFKKIKGGKDVDIDILSMEAEGDRLILTLAIEVDKKPFPANNPYVFVNPPILVPDGTTSPVLDEDPLTGGEIKQKANFKEDLNEALEQMVYETVRLQV